jgi:small-conductance mechanosensitive channel
MKRTLFGLILLALSVGSVAAAPAPGKAPDTRQVKAAERALIADAQLAGGLPTEAELGALIKTLEDDAERKKLIETLKTLNGLRQASDAKQKAQEAFGAQVLGFLSGRIDRLSREFVAGTRAILDLPNVFRWFVKQGAEPALRSYWIEIAWKLTLALFVGFVIEWLARLVLARPRALLEAREADGFWVKAPTLAARTVLDVIPIGGFLAGSYAVLSLVVPGDATRLAALAVINANVAMRIVLAVSRMILAPAASRLRLVPLGDEDSHYLFIWIRRFGQVAIYGYALIAAIVVLGLPVDGGETLHNMLGLFITLMSIVFILQNRANVATRLRGAGETGETPSGRSSRLRARLAEIWHVPTVLYILALYAVWALDIEDGFEFLLQGTLMTIAILIFAKLAMVGVCRIARHVFSLKPEVRQRYPGLEKRANRYVPILERGAGVVIGLIATFSILEAWGIDSFAWVATPFGQRVTGSLITVALLLVVAVVVWELINATVERYLSRDGGRVSARARTLLPLLRTVLLVVLVTLVVMVSLSELGLNIGPLLAGAGVIGLAIGFGAQTLVKDIITGLFILIEDHIAVGDVVKVGTHAGVVETLSLRTIKLRDVAGVVHVVPFSEVTTLENMTKDFSRYVFEVGVAYREDTDHVVEVLAALGEELRADPVYGPDILEPFEVLGVDSFGDNAVVIKARITTRPIKQWGIGREFNRRMKKRFDELGIEMPFPHRTIYFGEDKSGNAPPARIVTGDSDRQPVTAASPSAARRTSSAAVPESGGVDAPDSD